MGVYGTAEAKQGAVDVMRRSPEKGSFCMLRDCQALQPAGADSLWTTSAAFGTPR